MGILNFVQSLLGKRDVIAEASKLLDGKLDVKKLVTIFSTYLFASKLSQSFTDAKVQASSFVNQVNSIVNVNDCADVKEIISKLTSSNETDSKELARQLTKAVNLIKSMA